MQRLTLKRIRGSGFVMVAFALLVNVINYCFQILSGRFLSVEEYGLINTLFSLFLIFGAPHYAIQMLVAKQTAIYSAENDYQGQAVFLTQALIWVSLLAAGVWGFVTLIYSITPTIFGVEEYYLIFLAVIMSIATYYMFIPVGVAQGLQMFFIMTFISFVLAVLKVFSIFAAAFVLDEHIRPALTVMFMAIIGTVISTITGFALIRRRRQLRMAGLRQIRSFKNTISIKDSMQAIISNCVLILIMNMDVIFVSRAADEYTRGLYIASTMWGKILIYALMAVINLFYPKIVRLHTDGKDTKKLYFAVILFCVAAIGAMYLVVFIAAEPITALVFGERYLNSVEFISYSYAIAAAVVLNYLNLNYFLAVGRGKLVAWVFSATALFGILFGLVSHQELKSTLVVFAVALYVAFLIAFLCAYIGNKHQKIVSKGWIGCE